MAHPGKVQNSQHQERYQYVPWGSRDDKVRQRGGDKVCWPGNKLEHMKHYLLLAILAPTVAVAALILLLLCGCHETPEECVYKRAVRDTSANVCVGKHGHRMGNSTSHPIFVALKELLNTRMIKLRQKNLQCFIQSCEAAAPWFAVSGNLSVAS